MSLTIFFFLIGISNGEDQIHAELLKHAGREARTSIRKWFQKIWETGIVPSLWGKAILVSVLKTGKDPTSTASYRPISLTCTMGKIYGKNNQHQIKLATRNQQCHSKRASRI
jgi:hypothetical protein